jgi:glutamate-1-semialdehyde 2,1-aminomutase
MLNADICFGKVIGGLPVGAFAARAEIMDYLANRACLPSRNLIRKSIGYSAGLTMLQTVK